MPSHRKKGIAKKLVREAINRLSAKVILSTVLENNKASQTVLQRTLMVFVYVKTE